MVDAWRDKGNNVDSTPATLNPDDIKYYQVMDKLIETKKDKPGPTIEYPGSSSNANEHAAPPLLNPPPILMPRMDIDNVK